MNHAYAGSAQGAGAGAGGGHAGYGSLVAAVDEWGGGRGGGAYAGGAVFA